MLAPRNVSPTMGTDTPYPTLTLARWQQLWAALGASRCDDALFGQLLVAWNEPQRHYHTQQHLHECLDQFELLRPAAAQPAEIELALWFHDAVYDVHAHDNEVRSADWARSAMQAADMSGAIIRRVTSLILATRHDAAPQTCDEQLLLDIDLSILGATPERFAEYSRQIRAEYHWVPETLYRNRRAAILQQFLDRPRLFHNEAFFQHLESQARANLAQAIQQLR